MNINQQNSLLLGTDDSTALLTPIELAEYLNVGRNRAYDLLRKNIIKGFRIGSTWRVSKAAIDQYILENSGIL